ncbi:MAG: extracellular solute-binding protein [Protaetiibacter sp.]
MRKHTRITAVAAAATAIAVLAGCSPSGSDTGKDAEIVVGYSGGGVVDTYMDQIIAAARKALPDVTITTAVYPTYDDQLNQLPTQFAAGTAPDVILWDNAAPIAQYATEGAIVGLDELVAGTDVDLSLYPSALVDGWTVDGDLVGVPSYLQNSGIVYNEQVLAEAGATAKPATVAELGELARTVHASTGKPGIVLLDNLFHLTQYTLVFGGGWGGGDTIDSDENVEALDFLLGLFADGSAATAQQLGATWDGEAIANGSAAASDAGPWYIGFMQTTAPDVPYALEPLPGVSAGEQVVATYGGGFSVSARSENQEAAARVIAELTNAASQQAILDTGLGYVPAMTEYADAFREATPAYAAFTAEVLDQGRSLDYPLQTTEFGNALVEGFQGLVASKATSSRELLETLQGKYGNN